jgi:metal-responsive CopG/Arc/MetJ family transcriptional regulator
MSKADTGRKSVTLKKKNIARIEGLVSEKKYKNFSQAIDSAIEDKLQEVSLSNCNLKDIPEDITFINVAKKIAKELKNGN